jgi:hypothetical protein
MRVLLDECVPRDLVADLPGPEVWTVHGMGWTSYRNGALLRIAAGKFDVLVTVDRGIHRDHAVPGDIALVTVRAKSNRFPDLHPLAAELLRVIEHAEAGRHYFVGA